MGLINRPPSLASTFDGRLTVTVTVPRDPKAWGRVMREAKRYGYALRDYVHTMTFIRVR